MKWALVGIIAGLWFMYAVQREKTPVPKWYHPATHLLYAALLVAVIVWIT